MAKHRKRGETEKGNAAGQAAEQGEYRAADTDVPPRRVSEPRAAAVRGASARYGPAAGSTPAVPEWMHPEETARIIRRAQYCMARKAFPSDAALADAMGVHRSQISRWKAGEPASPENAWVLRDLSFAVETLSEHLEGSAIRRWLYGRSPELEGETPIESIREGRLPDVLMAFQAQVGGAYH